MDSEDVDTRRLGEGLWDWNLVSNRIHFSPGWLCLVGCEEHEVGHTQQAWLQRVHPEDLREVSQAIEGLLAHGQGEFEFRHRMLHRDGSYRWMSCRGVVQRDSAGQAVHVYASHADVTADVASDPLTGLPNRLLLMDRLTRSIERAARYPGFHFAVVCVDLDRQAPAAAPVERRTCDPLLSGAARRLETCLRTREMPPTLRNNDLVARLQGDEFAILLDGLKEIRHATIAADRILAEVRAPYVLGGREVRLAASVGIALSATGYERADDMLRDAETALHRAKLLGGSRCEVFDTAVLQSAQAELQLEADFTAALDRHEFMVVYQPIVSLSSNQIVGFEALVRWQHPVLGMIPPLEFIPLAEKTGFILPLSQWVLREACRQLKSWQNSLSNATELWVSVNLSSRQFRSTLVEEVAEILRDSALEARGLVLELTESMAMENPAAVTTLLMRLRGLGVRVSVDDFGTGHSALAYLRQFPLDYLKVDRSFVRGLENNAEMLALLGTVTGIAHQLGLEVVVEGVEKEEQLARIRSLDCAYGQGYLFSRPLDAAAMTAVLTTGLPTRQISPEKAHTLTLRADAQDAGQAEAAPRLPKMRWVYAGAAVVMLMLAVGLPRYFAEGPAPAASPTSLPDRASGASSVETPPPVVGVPPPPRAPAPQMARTAPASAAVRNSAARTERAEDRPTAPALAVTPTLTPTLTRALSTPLTSLPVIHQHRLGSCRGRLAVSREGVEFIPDARTKGDDAFKLKYEHLLPVLAGGNLTIRSPERVYRFKAAGGEAGKDDDRLERLVASMTQFR